MKKSQNLSVRLTAKLFFPHRSGHDLSGMDSLCRDIRFKKFVLEYKCLTDVEKSKKKQFFEVSRNASEGFI